MLNFQLFPTAHVFFSEIIFNKLLCVVKPIHDFSRRFSSQNRVSEITQSESQKSLHNYTKFHHV